jgi:hypothetical protein
MKIIEDLIKEINIDLNDINKQLEDDRIPSNIAELEEKITFFNEQVKIIGEPSKRQYSDVLNIWAMEVRKISEKLNFMMQDIRQSLESLQNQNKALKSYNYLKKN